MANEQKSNEFQKVDGTVNITEKGDVRSIYNYYLGVAQAKDHPDEPVTKGNRSRIPD